MLVNNANAVSLPISLGLVVSIIDDRHMCEIARGGPAGMPHDKADLEVWPNAAFGGAARLVALTPDGEAFLDLMRE